MINYSERIWPAEELIQKYLPFVSQDDSKVIQSFSDAFHHPWLEEFQSLSDFKRLRFEAFRDNTMLLDSEWKKLQFELKGISECENLPFVSNSLLRPPGKLKKQHELLQLTQVFEHFRGKSVVDFGGGVGNASYFFHKYFDVKPTIVEKDEQLICQGEKKFNSSLKYIHRDIQDDNCHSLLYSPSLAFGLHTCGDFAVNMLSTSFFSNVPYVINFGCCYSKMKKAFCRISNESDSKVRLNQRALSAATLSFAPTNEELYRFRLRILDYKYSFYHFLYQEYGQFEFFPMGNSRRFLYKLNFDQFAYKILQEYFPKKTLPSEKRLNLFFKSEMNRKMVDYFQAYYAISRYIGELIESYILIDRVLYGEKFGYKGSIKKVFDPKISPRCKGLFFEK